MSSRSIAFALLAVGFVTTAARFAVPARAADPASAAQQQQQQGGGDDLKKMVEAAKKWTDPSAAHKKLERFVGKWDVSTTMGGAPVGKQKAEYTSIFGGRFVKCELKGKFWIKPDYESLYLMGYDNFKQACHQQCLGHLLRRCHEMLQSATGGAVRFPRRIKGLLQAALDLRDRHAAGQVSEHGLAVA